MLPALPPQVTHRIDADVSAALKRFHAPGATIAVVDGTTVVYRHAYGLRRLSGLRADIHTHFGIGSITKQFTAAAIVQLQEAGKLEFDDKVSKYLPSAPHANEVTIRQLLTQTSGLPEYLDGPDIDQAMTKPASFATLMARIAGKPLLFTPGSAWSYCNTNYIMLGRIIEVASGETYQSYVRHHLLDPLGMKQTFTTAQVQDIADMAAGYHHVNGRTLEAPATHQDSWGWAAGDLVSNIDDLVKWSVALQNGRVVKPQDYNLMTTSQPLPQGNAGYGFALFVDSRYSQPRVGHTGGGFGYTAADEYYPKQHLRIIALTNAESGDPEAGETITNIVFADMHPEIVAKEFTPEPGEDAAVAATVRRAFLSLQTSNNDYSPFSSRFATKLRGGLEARLSEALAPFGAPSTFVYKGSRADKDAMWYDYEIAFSPGVTFRFGVKLDATCKVISISLG